MKKLENTENILEVKTSFDRKNKINRNKKKVDASILENIEDNGVTLEQLEELNKKGFKIFKYFSQITIHGIFPEIGNDRIFGYKNLFQNKNKSIGIRYNAIDEEKRQRIAERVKPLGIAYNRNSSETFFSITKRYSDEALAEMKAIAKKVNTDLIVGGVQLYQGYVWGMLFIQLKISVNAIYEKNIEPFLNELGATKEVLENYKKEEELKEQKEKEEREQREKERQEKKEKIKESEKENLDYLKNNYSYTKGLNEEGLYIKPSLSIYDESIEYRVFYLYKVKGKKKLRKQTESFDSLNEALNYQPKESFMDEVTNGVAGYKIA